MTRDERARASADWKAVEGEIFVVGDGSGWLERVGRCPTRKNTRVVLVIRSPRAAALAHLRTESQ